MSRHRNYRNYQYEDDMSDDVYGHSVEDHDICVSPTTAEQFMFRRSNSREPNLSSYMMDKFDSVEEEESEEELLASSQDYIRPKLDPESEAKLLSCLDQMHSILGDSCHEPTAVDAILRHNFDLEKAIDQVLGGDSSWDQAANTGSRKGTGSLCLSSTHSPIRNRNAKSETSPPTRRMLKGSRQCGLIPGLQRSDLSDHQGEGQMLGESSEMFCKNEGKSAPSTDAALESLMRAESQLDRKLLLQPLNSLSLVSGPICSATQVVAHSQQPSLSSLTSVPQGTLAHAHGTSLSGSLGALLQGPSLSTLGAVPQSNMAHSGGASSVATLGSFPPLSSLAHSQATPGSPWQSLSLSGLGSLSSGGPSGNRLSIASHAQTPESLQEPPLSRSLSTLSSAKRPIGDSLGTFPSLSSLAHSEVPPSDPNEGRAAADLLSAPLSSLSQARAQGPPGTGHSISDTQQEQKSELNLEKNLGPLHSSAVVRPTKESGASLLTASGTVSLHDLAKVKNASAKTAPTLGALTYKPEPRASESGVGRSSAGSGHLGAVSLSELAQGQGGPSPALSLASSAGPPVHTILGAVSLSELARGGNGSALSTARQVPPHHSTSTTHKLPASQVGLSGRAGLRSQPPEAWDLSLAKGLSVSKRTTSLVSGTLERQLHDPKGIVDTSRFGDDDSLRDSPHPAAPRKLHLKSTHVSVESRIETSKAAKCHRSNLITAPSMFALTLSHRVCSCSHPDARLLRAGDQPGLTSLGWVLDSSIQLFDFSTPSPDDVVVSKQRDAFSGKKR